MSESTETPTTHAIAPMPAPAPVATQTTVPQVTTVPQEVVTTPPGVATPAPVQEAAYVAAEEAPTGPRFNNNFVTKSLSKDTLLNVFASLPTNMEDGRATPFGDNYNAKANTAIIYSNMPLVDFKVATVVNALKNMQAKGTVMRILWTDKNVLGQQLASQLDQFVNGKPVLEIYIPWESEADKVPEELRGAITSTGPSYEAMFKQRQTELFGYKDAPEDVKKRYLERIHTTSPSFALVFKALELELAYGYNIEDKARLFVTNHDVYTDFKLFKEANKELFYFKDNFTSKFKLGIEGVNLSTKSALAKLI